MKLEISIIIINYNTYELVVDCVKSIIAETKAINFEILIVDNASKQRSIEKIVELDSRIRLINSEENLGFGRANNLGMQHSKGECFLLLNSDTLIIKNGIERCYSFYKEFVKSGLVGCKELDVDLNSGMPLSFYLEKHSLVNYFLRMPFLQIIRLKLENKKNEDHGCIYKANSISGAFMFLSKDVFEKTRGFDPDFFMYYEETEWCRRIRKEFPIYYNAEVEFIHLKGKSASPEIMIKQMHLSAGLFWYKKGGLSYLMFLLISYFVYFPSWCILWVVSFNKGSKVHYMKYIRIYLGLINDYIMNVLKYSNSYNARKKMLKLRGL